MDFAQHFGNELLQNIYAFSGPLQKKSLRACAIFGQNFSVSRGIEMSASTVEQRALSLLNTFEKAGRTVSRVTIEGKKIELVLSTGPTADEFERIDMRYDKT
jgi:hypothetical protein